MPATAETKAELSTAHVALAELFMTDLCDEEEAAAEARKHINLSTEVDPSNPEGWQALASFLLVLENLKKRELQWREVSAFGCPSILPGLPLESKSRPT